MINLNINSFKERWKKLSKLFFPITLILILILAIVAFKNVQYQALLTNSDGWNVTDTFLRDGEYPSDKNALLNIKSNIKNEPELWASYGGDDNNTGRIVSAPFIAPSNLMLFIVGYPLNPQNQIYLEQIDTGAQISYATFNPGEKWKRINIALPEEWQQTRIRVVAIDNAKGFGGWLGFSTPYRVPWWHFYKQYSKFGLVFLFLLFFLPGFIPASIFSFDLKSVFYFVAVTGLVCLLINFRYVCAEPEKFRTGVLFAYLFFIFTPCLYVCFRILLPKFLGMFLFLFFLLLALFPYKIFFAPEINLCDYFLYFDPPILFNLPRYWIIILFGFLALAMTSCWQWYKKRQYSWVLPKKEIAVSLLFLFLMLVQILPQLETDALKGIPDECEGRCKEKFFGYCVTCDVRHHTMINGMYRGVADNFNNFVINRRGLSPFLYTLAEPYITPYYAAIIINSFFFYLIILSGYALAVHFKLNTTIAIISAILLASNKLLHLYTLTVAFYLAKTAFAFLILTAGYKLHVFSKTASLKSKLLFCSVLASCSLTYDPYIFVAFLFFWALFHALGQIKVNPREAGRVILHGICYCIVPMLSLFIFENILKYYAMEGYSDNLISRRDIFAKLPIFPAYLFNHTTEMAQLAGECIDTLIFSNPQKMEYIELFGSFGVISFFVFIPKYIKSDKPNGLYAIYLATLSIPLFAMLIASIPPLAKYSYIYVSFIRTTDYLPALVLAQSIGLYYVTKASCGWLQIGLKPSYAAYGASLFIYLYAYFQLSA